MLSDYTPLQLHALTPGADLTQTDLQNCGYLKISHPALDVMTDLHLTTAVTISPDAGIENAEERMRRRGVRLLFVQDGDGTLAGLITATDLLGEKPLQYIERHGGKHRDIRVQDIMTPRERLEVLQLTDVQAARIGNIVATLRAPACFGGCNHSRPRDGARAVFCFAHCSPTRNGNRRCADCPNFCGNRARVVTLTRNPIPSLATEPAFFL